MRWTLSTRRTVRWSPREPGERLNRARQPTSAPHREAGIRDFRLTATRVNTAKGEYAIGIGADITERMQMETELRESELAYRTLSQNLPGMVYRVYIREGVCSSITKCPSQMTGYAEDELTTGEVCSIEPLILDEDLPGVEAEVTRAIAGNVPSSVEYRLKHKDGGYAGYKNMACPFTGRTARHLILMA